MIKTTDLFLYVVISLTISNGIIVWVKAEDLPDFYTFVVKDISENNVPLEKYRGSVTLVVNVASQCGFTDSHYKDLTRLHDILSYGGRFHVLAFPCNQFDEQEPADNKDIADFVRETYQAEFPLFAKIDVIGESAEPAFKNLISQSSRPPDWNFYKYLVNENGRVLDVWGPRTGVEDIFDTIQKAVEDITTTVDEQVPPTPIRIEL